MPLLNHDTAVIVPTHNAMKHFKALTKAIEQQPGLERDRVLVIDSSSRDGTAEQFSAWGARVITIPQCEFDHGGTRRKAAELTAPSRFLVYLTQDAIPQPGSLERLLAAFDDSTVGMAYGCQLPRPQARAIERHARLANYPAGISETRMLADKKRLGVKTTFCSDSFAAYRREALDAVGGMPELAFFGEDQITAGRMLLAGWALRYQGDAQAVHSHGYSLREDFKRYFDVGVFHAQNPWLLTSFGRAEGEGLRFVRSELRYLSRHEPVSMPGAIARTFAKYFGYRLGRLERHLRPALKKRLSMSPHHWHRLATTPSPSIALPP